jgi:hypothetical protein
MAEYIEREALMATVNEWEFSIEDVDCFVQELEKIPAADVVEVVRCKDCRWYQEGRLLAPNKFCFRLKHPKEDRKIGYNYAPDDFCSYGERRETDA